MGKAIMAIMALLAVSACTPRGGNFCDIAKPIRPSQAAFAAMDDQDQREMRAHNEKGAALCGWRP